MLMIALKETPVFTGAALEYGMIDKVLTQKK